MNPLRTWNAAGHGRWFTLAAGLVLAALLGSLAGCATPPTAADTLNTYRGFSCDTLDTLDKNFSTSMEKAASTAEKAVWLQYLGWIRQVQTEKSCPRKAMLGVRLNPIDPVLVKQLGLESARGAVIAEVVKGTPAERASLFAGDIILGFNGEGMATPAEVTAAIGKLPPNSKAEVLVWRSGKKDIIVVDFAPESASKAAPAATSLMDAATADFDAGKYADAARKYQQILQQSPDDALTWYFYGQTMEKLGDVIGAQEAYRRVLTIQPKGQVADYARQALARLAPAAGGKKAAKKK